MIQFPDDLTTDEFEALKILASNKEDLKIMIIHYAKFKVLAERADVDLDEITNKWFNSNLIQSLKNLKGSSSLIEITKENEENLIRFILDEPVLRKNAIRFTELFSILVVKGRSNIFLQQIDALFNRLLNAPEVNYAGKETSTNYTDNSKS